MNGALDNALEDENPRSIATGERSLSRLGPLDLYGHGNVGAKFAQLLATRGITPRSISTTCGVVSGRQDGIRPSIVVDCTSPAYQGQSAQEWIATLEDWLEQGVDLVTCNKAPLALAWDRLKTAARRGGARILASATVGGGVPVLPFLTRLEDTIGVSRIEACASGTLGHVLDKIAVGESIDDAVASAQTSGFAEPDPLLDINGTDLAAKSVILHNFLSQTTLRRLNLASAPFLGIQPERVRRIADAGGTPRAVARVERGAVELTIANAPWAVGPPGDAVVRIQTSDGSHFLIRGPGAGPQVTAANLLADLESLADRNGA